MSPGCRAFFGASIEEAESPELAVKREGLEELTYIVAAPRLLAAQKFVYGRAEYSKRVFIEEYDEAALTLGEAQGMRMTGRLLTR